MNNMNRPLVNMRRTLRMNLGGEMPMNTTPMSSQDSAALGNMSNTMLSMQSAPTASAAPTAPTSTPKVGAADYSLPGNTFSPMAVPQLRDGGDLKTGHGGKVPGKGKGDKVKALYEPGEFVVSNDMLKAQPGLRDQLHDLRGNVLAAKGMTPQEADAKATSGGTLRALEGGPEDTLARRYAKLQTGNGLLSAAEASAQGQPAIGEAAPTAKKIYTPPPVDSTGQYTDGRRGTYGQGTQNTGAGIPNSSGAGNPNLAGGAGRAGVSLEPTTGGLIRDKLLGSSKDWSKAGELANKARNLPGVGMAGTLLKGAAAPVSAYQTYQDVQKGDYGSAAVHGVDTAAGAALFTPAAPVAAGYLGARAAYEAPQLIRDQLGETGLDAVGGTINQIGLRSGLWGMDDSTHLASRNAPLAPAAPPKYTPRPDSVTPWGNEGNRKVSNINAPGGNVRGTEDFTKALNTQPADLPAGLRDGMVYKTKDAQGRVTYSGRNVSGDVSNRMLNGDGTSAGTMRGSLRNGNNVVMGPNGSYVIDDQAKAMTREQTDKTMTNPDGSKWSAQDNATMAANLRDGVSTYQGTSRQPALDAEANAPKRGEFGYKNYMANKQKDADRAVTERGQQLEMERARMTAQASLRKNQFDMQRDVRKDGREQAAHDEAMGEKSREAIAKEFTVYDTDKDGRQVANPAASTASLDALRSILPGMTSTDPKAREAALSDAKAMHGIFLKARNQNPVGWEAMKFWKPQRPELSGMPDATGGSIEQLSGFSGAMTVNAKNGDTLLRQKDGREINLGQLDARQRKLLEDAQQRGWGK